MIAYVALLERRITHKDAFKRLRIQLHQRRCGVVDICGATEHLRKKICPQLHSRETRGHLVDRTAELQALGRETVDEMRCRQNCHAPITPGNTVVEQESVSYRRNIPNATLDDAVLLRSRHIGGFMKNSLRGKKNKLMLALQKSWALSERKCWI